jgi:ABC-type dipeptide/oligopeptide/nickel transport system permease subunit
MDPKEIAYIYRHHFSSDQLLRANAELINLVNRLPLSAIYSGLYPPKPLARGRPGSVHAFAPLIGYRLTVRQPGGSSPHISAAASASFAGIAPFGSDKQGRNLFAVMIAGTPLTLRIGLIAGFIGLGFGALLAFVGAYYGGWVDALLRGIVDVGLTVPGLMVLIVVAMMVRSGLTVEQMALVVASIAWLYPARTIRAQVLTLRERSYVQVARLSGMPGRMIILKEILPNLLPYLAASLAGSISAAVLASVGLEVLGLGPIV